MKRILLVLTVVILGIAACDTPEQTTGGNGTDTTSINNNNMNTDTTTTQPTQPDTSQNR